MPPSLVATGQGRRGSGCHRWCVQTQLWGPAADSRAVAGPFANRHMMVGALAAAGPGPTAGALAALGGLAGTQYSVYWVLP